MKIYGHLQSIDKAMDIFKQDDSLHEVIVETWAGIYLRWIDTLLSGLARVFKVALLDYIVVRKHRLRSLSLHRIIDGDQLNRTRIT